MLVKSSSDIFVKELDLFHVVQPIVDISDDKVYGYEMLLRSKEFDNPEILFKHAEKQNQSFDLDMRSIFKAFEAFNKNTSLLDGLYLFINILPSTIGNSAYPERLQAIESTLKLEPSKIVFEITEDKKEAELMMCQSYVTEMKDQGFLIALDDLGKGDSTIDYALQLEPHIVKLDRYFAKDLANSFEKQKAIEFMFNLLSEDTILILEGIETEADLQTAKNLGVRYVQGFYLGRPQPLEYYI